MSEAIVFTDRYGERYPDPQTVCNGQCEGMGCYPVYNATAISYADLLRKDFIRPTVVDNSPEDNEAWQRRHEAVGEHACDGYHFVTCRECNGSGKAGAP